MGRLCMPGGAVLGIVSGGVTFRFLNGEAILDENMLFWVRLYALVKLLVVMAFRGKCCLMFQWRRKIHLSKLFSCFGT